MDELVSHLKIYSLGIVIKDKEDGSDYIEVSPIETLPLINDNLTNFTYKYNTNNIDTKGIKSSNELKGNNILIAKWLSLSVSNRMTSPDVYKSETVLLFKFADTDDYYWTTLFREPLLRKLETVNYMFSNIKKFNTAYNKETSYWFEISTKDKYIHLHTSNNDGEPFEYDIKLDTSKGILTISDNIENFIKLDSPNSDVEITTNNTVTVNTTIVNINCATVNISNDLNVGGNTSIAKNTTIGKSLSTGTSGGTCNFGGTVNVTGDITTNGNITASGSVTGSNIQ